MTSHVNLNIDTKHNIETVSHDDEIDLMCKQFEKLSIDTHLTVNQQASLTALSNTRDQSIVNHQSLTALSNTAQQSSSTIALSNTHDQSPLTPFTRISNAMHQAAPSPVSMIITRLKQTLVIGQQVSFLYPMVIMDSEHKHERNYILSVGVIDTLDRDTLRILLLPDCKIWWKGPYIHLLPDEFRESLAHARSLKPKKKHVGVKIVSKLNTFAKSNN